MKVPTPWTPAPPVLHPGPDHFLPVSPMKCLLTPFQCSHVFCSGEEPLVIFATLSVDSVPRRLCHSTSQTHLPFKSMVLAVGVRDPPTGSCCGHHCG